MMSYPLIDKEFTNMNLQHERLDELCHQLQLQAIAQHYSTYAQTAAETQQSYSDFLEELLRLKQTERQARGRSILTCMAGFPMIKTLDDYDFKFATGVPQKKTLNSLP